MCSSHPLETKRDLRSEATFVHISLLCLRNSIKFFIPMIYFLLTKSRSIESHVTAKMLDPVCNLTSYWLSLITLFAYFL